MMLSEIRLNEILLKSLTRVLHMTHADVAEAAGIAITTWYRLIKDPQRFSVQQLLDLANGLQIPVSKFFSKRKDKVGTRDDYIMYENYKICFYDKMAMSKAIGDGTPISWHEASKIINMNSSRASDSLLGESRTPVIRLLKLCNAFHFDVFNFIVDPNIKHPDYGKDGNIVHFHTEINPVNELATVEDFLMLRNEISELRKELAEARKELNRVENKYLAENKNK